MRATANQKPLPLRLPELRNLGTVLRILLAVNAFALLAVLAREQRWSAVPSAWLEMAGLLEPHLLLNLLLLYMLAPWLEQLPYRVGALCILTLIAVVTLVLNGAFTRLGLDPFASDPLR